MSEYARTVFWERPVRPATPADVKSMTLFRRSTFPANEEPVPWLDRPDAEAQIAERQEAGDITAAEATLCRQWARDGYVILPGFYRDAQLDQAWAGYETAIAAGQAAPPDEPLYKGDPRPGRLLNAHFQVPAIDEMLREPRISHVVSVLLGALARPFQTIIGHKSSQQLEHSDSIHMTTYPQGYLAATWVAFEDVKPGSGPLVYYPGSHRLPYVLAEDLEISPEVGMGAYASVYEPAIQSLIAEHELAPAHFLPKKGDVLIWHANLLHGGTKVTKTRLTRKALVCHYFAEGVVCYHDVAGTLSHLELGSDMYARRPAPGLLGRAVAGLRRRMGV